MTDRERAIQAIRRGVPLGEVVKCACFTNPPTRKGCFGVCEDSVAAIIASYEDLRRGIRAHEWRAQVSEAEKRILQNQIDIMWVLHRFMGKHEPDMVGRGGELDALRADLVAACKDSRKLLESA